MNRKKTDINAVFPDFGDHFERIEKKREKNPENQKQAKHHPVRSRICPERFPEKKLLISPIPGKNYRYPNNKPYPHLVHLLDFSYNFV